MDDIAIKVDGVYKDFVLVHERKGTVKGVFTSMFRKVTIKKETQHALKDISLDIKKGEFFGIVGRNGSGKSTLLKILAGIYQPTKGTVSIQGKLVPFIELGVGFNPELSGRDNVYLNGAVLGFSVKEVDSMYDDIVEFAELERFMDQKLKNYSSGMQVRLAFSMATRAKADILLIDEVLAVGDTDFQRKCFNYFKELKKNKKTVVFVSHDMSAIGEYCDRAVLIENSLIIKTGKASTVAAEYSKLFINNENSNVDNNESKDEIRWGNGDIKIISSKASVDKNNLLVKVKAKVNKDLDSVMYGIHIISQEGNEITAMNNRMIQQPDLRKLEAGSIIEVTWDMLNIFNDGKYYVTLTLVDEAGTVFDWFSEATSFTVKRMRRSTTAVLPPLNVRSKVIKP